MSPVDRAAAVRSAVRALVADRGFHGTSMAAVATEAGVATGTAYIHYASKDELLVAAYLELKADLARAAVAGLDPSASPDARFRALWDGLRQHLEEDPTRARFLLQVEASPLAAEAHRRALAVADDPLLAEVASPALAERLRPLPPEVLWDLGFGPVIRLVASGVELDGEQLDDLADACWRAVTLP